MNGVRVKVKICGVTRVQDALAASEAGADAVGLMFYERSPRFVMRQRAADIIAALPPFVAKVGVFVDAPEEEVRRTISECGLDTLQFHGQESPEYCRRFGLKVIKAFRIRDAQTLPATGAYDQETWLLDSYAEGAPGGTGKSFNWDLAATVVRGGGRILLAGGLTPQNVGQAVTQVRPFGVDVSSGVESAPGIKDSAKIRAFIEAARADASSP
jgi:phosphoribosylanthranilate isomerase